MSWLVCINLTQATITRDKGPSTEKMLPSKWAIDKPLGQFLNSDWCGRAQHSGIGATGWVGDPRLYKKAA